MGQFFSKLLNFITQYGLSHILPQPSNIFTHLHFTIWVASVTFRNSGGKTRCMLSFLGSSPTPSLWLDHRVEIRHSSELYLGIQISSTAPTKCCLKHLQCICCCLFKNLFFPHPSASLLEFQLRWVSTQIAAESETDFKYFCLKCTNR